MEIGDLVAKDGPKKHGTYIHNLLIKKERMIIDEIKKLNKPEFLNMLKDINKMHDIEITMLDTNPDPESKELLVITKHRVEEWHNRYRGSCDQVFNIKLKYKGVDIEVSGEYGGYGEDDLDMVDIGVDIDTTDNILIKEANEKVLNYKVIHFFDVEYLFTLAAELHEEYYRKGKPPVFDINKSSNQVSIEY